MSDVAEKLEKNLDLVGATAIEDKLQEVVLFCLLQGIPLLSICCSAAARIFLDQYLLRI